MLADWAEMELGELIELKRGYDLPKNNRNDGDIPVISSSGESGLHDVYKVRAPGVVTGRYGTIGDVFFAEKDFWPLNTTLYVKDFKGNDHFFVYYFLKTISYSDYSDKAAVPGVNRNHLHKALIKVPRNVEYQKLLAEILRGFDLKITLNTETNQTLEAIAQAIFKSWFVDFEPVKAKMAALEAGGTAEEAERAAMCAISGKDEAALTQLQTEQPDAYAELAETAALFPSAMQDSELVEIPEGWDIQRLESLIELAYGKALKSIDRIEGTVPVYGSGGINGTHCKALVQGPGIVIGRKGTVGSIYWEQSDFFPIDTTFYVKTKENVTLEFAFYLIQTLGLNDMNTDAAVPGLNRNNVYRLEVPGFPNELIKSFTKVVSSISKAIQNLKVESNTLAEARDNLLPKLLSGELTLPPAETVVADADSV